MKLKIISVPIMAVILFGSTLGPWAYTLSLQGQCCPWGELFWETLRVAPFSIGFAIVAYMFVRIYEGVTRH